MTRNALPEDAIAVVGLGCRFPGARNADEFWRNLCGGVESIRTFSTTELADAGVDPSLAGHPRYVPRRGTVDGIERFDAEFFGLTPREAEITDPQHRLFLECAWQALESAGYAPGTFEGRAGVYAGVRINSYLLRNLLPNRELVAAAGDFPVLTGNDKDYLSTRVSYKLDLRGPSVTVQTACSTSLVAVHLACESLLSGECDLALAGGVNLEVPQAQGYVYAEEGILAPDGHCRAFDAAARGTVPGSGLGAVVLKRLDDAVDDGDRIRAVLRGWAMNNDGGAKVGYTAPGEDGQAQVIAEALTVSGVDPSSIGYVETHGTGTLMGDPIEISALTRAFRTRTDATGFCAIGSVKTNIGHLDTAAGVAGLIKTVLALEHRRLPPSLHFERPNPRIDFESTPFFVQSELTDWHASDGPRRAGLSSFGIGGTNVHLVLEEAPPRRDSEVRRAVCLLPLSARTEPAVEEA
ncbi:MAG: polyketide synthase, partial [Acidobacteriota bacterium]